MSLSSILLALLFTLVDLSTFLKYLPISPQESVEEAKYMREQEAKFLELKRAERVCSTEEKGMPMYFCLMDKKVVLRGRVNSDRGPD